MHFVRRPALRKRKRVRVPPEGERFLKYTHGMISFLDGRRNCFVSAFVLENLNRPTGIEMIRN